MSDLIVLCYHALSRSWPADLSTTPERFERQLSMLLERGYRGVTFTQALSSPPAGRAVAVTFDDAYRSVGELARPILDRLGLAATVFVPTDFIAARRPMSWPGVDHWLEGPHEAELTPLSWAELGELAAAGWEIGSHTASHPRLTRLSDAALEDELVRSKAACESQLGIACDSLAYPYGDVDARVIAHTARAGYRAAAALGRDLRARGVLQWPRIGVYQRDDARRFRLKVSPFTRRVRGSGAWAALRAHTGRS